MKRSFTVMHPGIMGQTAW